MSWIEKIQQKTPAEKMRIIWMVVIVALILLIATWVIGAQYKKIGPKDTTLFQTLDRGINDVRTNFKK